MKRLKRMGINTIVISATLANSAVNDLGHRISRADDPPQVAAANPAAARKAAIALQQAKKQQEKAARLKRQAQRLLASQTAAQIDATYAAGFNPWNNGSSPMGWGSNGGASGGFPGTSAANSSSTGASGGTTAAGGQTTGTGQAGGNGQDSLVFNAKILEFAVNHLGMQVGNGECWTLAEDALIYAGAKPAVGYVFGDKISLSSAQPGDILQFESAVFVAPTYWMQMGFPHHTAIVDAVQGSQYVILQQNVNGNLKVQMSTINMADLRSGTVTAYRAVANNATPAN
jgi:hypothetical protein